MALSPPFPSAAALDRLEKDARWLEAQTHRWMIMERPKLDELQRQYTERGFGTLPVAGYSRGRGDDAGQRVGTEAALGFQAAVAAYRAANSFVLHTETVPTDGPITAIIELCTGTKLAKRALGRLAEAGEKRAAAGMAGQKAAEEILAAQKLAAKKAAEKVAADLAEKKLADAAAGLAQPPSTWKSVKGLIDDLPGKKGKGGPIKEAPDEAALDKIFDEATRGGKTVDPGTYKGKVIELPDGTVVARRAHSKSGGATLDITSPDGKIHRVHLPK